ncbi:MAG: UvrB/UvrC motif-containing protein [bacterium]
MILYSDNFTESMVKALWETYRRRGVQDRYNKKHHITPQKAESNVKGLDVVKTDEVLSQSFDKLTRGKTKKLKRMTKVEKEIILKDLKKQLDESIVAWKFEDAAIIRDQIKEIS